MGKFKMGKNCCGEKKSNDGFMENFAFPYAYYVTIFATFLIEFLGLARFYYIQDWSWAYSNACFLHTLFCIVINIPIFWSLTKIRNEDAGYVISDEDKPLKKRDSDHHFI